MLLACRKLYPANDLYHTMMKHGHTSEKQYNCLRMEVRRCFVTKDPWPPYSPDLNPFDFFFWTQVKRKVYEGKLTPFKNLDELKRKIKSVWPHVEKLLWLANYSTSHTAVQRKIEICRWSLWPTNQANFLICLLSILIVIVNWLLNSHMIYIKLNYIVFFSLYSQQPSVLVFFVLESKWIGTKNRWFWK